MEKDDQAILKNTNIQHISEPPSEDLQQHDSSAEEPRSEKGTMESEKRRRLAPKKFQDYVPF